MSRRASSTLLPLVRTYRAPSPSTRASSATDRTRSFLWVISIAASRGSACLPLSLRARRQAGAGSCVTGHRDQGPDRSGRGGQGDDHVMAAAGETLAVERVAERFGEIAGEPVRQADLAVGLVGPLIGDADLDPAVPADRGDHGRLASRTALQRVGQ